MTEAEYWEEYDYIHNLSTDEKITYSQYQEFSEEDGVLSYQRFFI